MVEANPQAVELNKVLQKTTIYSMLSGRGKAIFFPKKGILAQTADAKGKDLNATIGIALEEDLTPMRLKPLAKLTKKIDPKDAFPYAPSYGKQELREKWKEMIKVKNPSLKAEISLPIVTNALTHGLSMAGYLFVSPGDKIITPDLFWGNYKLILQNTYGAELDPFNTFKGNRFDLESFRNKLNEESEKKIILLNFPNNPTGYTISEAEAEEIVKIIKEAAEKSKIIVIIDDAYFGLVYKYGIYKESLFSKLADIHENVLAVKLDGATKEDYVWGFRVGFITFGIKNGNKDVYTALEDKASGAVRATISNASHLSQSLVLTAFSARNYVSEKEKKYNILKSRYDEVRRVLQDEKYSEYFTTLPFNSGYFMCIQLKDLDAERVRQLLLNKYSTGVISIDDKLRVAFSSINKDGISKLFENIYKACKEIKGSRITMDDSVINQENKEKLEVLNNPNVIKIIEKYVKHCNPSKVTVITDSKEDIDYVRNLSLENKEESKLKMEGHTIHYDGVEDQARDKANTKVLVEPGVKLSSYINQTNREEGLKEVLEYFEGSMEGKEMIIRFFCLGPVNSKFSLLALQLTDSSYVGHSEDILYRKGYEQFKTLNGSDEFFHFIHSAGKLDKRGNCVDTDKRRIYIDLDGGRVFTINNQYAGNSVGLKKLALRLAIHKANKEDWLAEHMLIMGVKPEDKNRITYFTGAFPSACGKTSTAMVPGQTIVGDDIAYLRIGDDKKAYAANIEQGVFGIIMDVNPKDDPLIYKALTTPREVIFSNVLVKDGKPYWAGMGVDVPADGYNYQGEWKKDAEGKEIPCSHKNARYTIRINELDNADSKADSPEGVPIDGVIYGGRDSDTFVPVLQSNEWSHGVFMGAALESEMAFASLDKEGVRTHDPMANRDFIVVPLGLYIRNHLKFGDGLKEKPLVFTTNYFLKKDGKYLNEILDKKIWLLWMEGRVHNEYSAIETPVGFIPVYSDLQELFKQVFSRDYSLEEYNDEFSIKIPNYLAKLDRIEEAFKKEGDIPNEFFKELNKQRERLMKSKEQFGKEIILPSEFKDGKKIMIEED